MRARWRGIMNDKNFLGFFAKIIIFYFLWSSVSPSIPSLAQQWPPPVGGVSGLTSTPPSVPSTSGKIPELSPSEILKLQEILKEAPPEKLQEILKGVSPEKLREMIKGTPPEIPKEEAPKTVPAPSAPKEKSEIEAILSGKIPSTVSVDLAQFGYELFRATVSTFAPVTDVPVGPDYVIGPGDRFTIFVWGRIDLSHQVEVGRDGEISIPKIGVLKVWGLTFSQMRDYIIGQLSRYYKDFQLNLSMDRLRTIRVYVVGEAVNPGSYSLSSLSTVYNALFAAGGPSKRGTLRKIQLLRNGKAIRTVDLYEFLLKGDRSQDERLQSGDTIFIPVIGPVAGIAGNIKRPAIYELKGPMNLGELIELSGGVSPIGYLQRVQIERVVAHEKRIVEDFDLSSFAKGEAGDPKLAVKLQDADLVKIFPIYPKTEKIVYLEGHVKRPGGYEIKEGMRVLDLIPSIKDLLPEPYLKYAYVVRLIPPDLRPSTLPVNLEKLYLHNDQGENIPLQELDRLLIFGLKDMREIPQVTASGELNKPAKFPWVENMRVKDLIYQAGNLKRSAYLAEAEITRLVKGGKEVASKLIYVDLNEVLKENPAHNILLEEDDQLTIRQIPRWYVDKKVSVMGEVKFPGAYTYQKGERLSSVLERAGGFTPDAYLLAAFFTRESVRKVQEKRIQEFIEEQERELIKEGGRLTEGALSKDEAEQRQKAMAQKKELIARLKAATVTGRVIIKLAALEKFKGSEYDLELEDGDTFLIPPTPSSVLVMGRVYNANAILYSKDKPLNYYLSKVGGPAENADEKRIYLVRADGAVISRTQESLFGFRWDPDTSRWASGGFMETPIGPGDTILVPEKFERIYWARELKDWTQILYQIAVAAGVIVALY